MKKSKLFKKEIIKKKVVEYKEIYSDSKTVSSYEEIEFLFTDAGRKK